MLFCHGSELKDHGPNDYNKLCGIGIFMRYAYVVFIKGSLNNKLMTTH